MTLPVGGERRTGYPCRGLSGTFINSKPPLLRRGLASGTVMRIAGLHKTTLLDFPSKVSCIVFTGGCNFHCPYCHNPELLEPGGHAALSEETFFSFLRQRRGLLEGVVISGGEPTLQNDLPDFCGEIKKLGFAVKLDTNGSRPSMMEALVSRELVDYVAMDLKSDPAFYPAEICPPGSAAGIPESLSLLKSYGGRGGEYELRTTCVSPLLDARAAEALMAALDKGTRWYLQKARVSVDAEKGREDPVLSPDFFRNGGRAWSPDELDDLRARARHAGIECEIR